MSFPFSREELEGSSGISSAVSSRTGAAIGSAGCLLPKMTALAIESDSSQQEG